MKTKNLFLFSLLLFVLFSTENTFAQSVTVTPKKTVYKRPKPLSEYKKSFTVTRPIVKGVSAVLKKKIETSIGYEKNFGFNVKEEIDDVQWLEKASYEVLYNKNGVLDLMLSMEGSGAYPSNNRKNVVVNLKTGEKIEATDIFIKLNELAAMGKKMQQAEIKKAIVDIKKENPGEENPAGLFESSNFTVVDLNAFSVSDKGVTFQYDYGFPHVILALQPDGQYFFSWAKLKPFVKRDGAFGKLVR